MMQQRAGRYRYQDVSPWARIHSDLDQIKGQMVTKVELAAMMATKADAAVAEERWKGVWQDIAEMRAEMRNRPQQQQQTIFSTLGCSFNGLLVLIGAGSMFAAIAAVIVTIISLLLR